MCVCVGGGGGGGRGRGGSGIMFSRFPVVYFDLPTES